MDPTPGSSQSTSIESWVAEVRAQVERHVCGALAYYSGHTKTPRILFRTLGVVTIGGSILLPAISSMQPCHICLCWLSFSKDSVVTGLAVLIALSSGMNAFFQPHETWRQNMKAKLAPEELLAIWNLRLLAARQSPDDKTRVENVIKATESLFAEASRVGTVNTEGFFKNVHMPRPQGK